MSTKINRRTIGHQTVQQPCDAQISFCCRFWFIFSSLHTSSLTLQILREFCNISIMLSMLDISLSKFIIYQNKNITWEPLSPAVPDLLRPGGLSHRPGPRYASPSYHGLWSGLHLSSCLRIAILVDYWYCSSLVIQIKIQTQKEILHNNTPCTLTAYGYAPAPYVAPVAHAGPLIFFYNDEIFIIEDF